MTSGPHDRHPDHHLDPRSFSESRLRWALVINMVFLLVEITGGILSHSLALLADAGHMLTDVAALGLSLFVASLARRPATPERTFGLLRAEVLGAFLNGATLVVIVGFIFWEAWQRFGHPEMIDGPLMLVIAFFGLLANIGSALILQRDREENVNVQGAFLHMVSDALGSVGVIAAGLIIWATSWYPIDSIASVVIGLLILWSTRRFLKRTMNILLEATPENISFMEVKQALEEMEHIREVHDLHIWTITSGMPVLSAHLILSSGCCDTPHWQECLDKAHQMLKRRFNISHTTLQVEPTEGVGGAACQLEGEAPKPNGRS